MNVWKVSGKYRLMDQEPSNRNDQASIE